MNNITQIQDAYFADKISLLQAARYLGELGYTSQERAKILVSMRNAKKDK